jgi:predicted  nucleic acid-binding Zn-ribbon protein
MPSNSDRSSSDVAFRKVEAKLGSIQAAAKKISETPESRLKRTLNPAAFAARQGDFNVAVVEALKEAVTALRETITNQDTRLEQLERDLTEMRSLSTEVRELRERSVAAETQLAQMRQEQGELREHSAAAGTQLTQLVEKIGQFSAGQGDMGSELRERIQHLLDEQRVCLRQLSLKTSEEAVLAERARRATELRLEELARRLPEGPA